ncbi:hypothetical protein GCM10010327_66090 [Streptomyces nitrosporeus]|nr:hypothetical protein GCM10010327_66090 [Streptomyces nitrosporeus]
MAATCRERRGPPGSTADEALREERPAGRRPGGSVRDRAYGDARAGVQGCRRRRASRGGSGGFEAGNQSMPKP